MRLDNRSVLVTIVSIELMVSLLLVVYTLTVRRARRGALFWAAAYGSLFLGLLLLSGRDLLPLALTAVLANVLLLGFFQLIVIGIRQYRGLRTAWAVPVLACAGIAAWMGYFTLIRPALLPRLLFFDLSVAALGLVGAIAIGRKPAKGVRVLSGIIAAILLAIASSYLLRFAFNLADGGRVELMDMSGMQVAIEIFGAVLIAGLALALILLHSSILAEKLAAAARERELLVREIAHRTKNDLALVDSLISIDQRSIADRDPIGAARLGSLRDRIRCLSLAHERLSQSEDPGLVRLDEYLEVIAESLPANQSVRVERAFAPLEAPFSYAAPLGLAMNELATNALKYAFPEGRGGTIRLALRVAAGGGAARAELEVRDDGIGTSWPPERQGFGTLIVQSFAAKIGASIDYRFDGGSVFCLGFDLPLRPERA